ncbi:nuclear transport factor 2 family protein [Candidatus Gracilibacteria bacterium]|nr:nuclear transport factor 2 family protein [Candidatus Gracilibacteria bacterium]
MKTENRWLNNFHNFWLSKNIDGVMSLFKDDVIYFETPYQKITDKSTLKKEWLSVQNHEIDALNFEVYCETENKIVTKFTYEYRLNGEKRSFAGVYLIELEGEKCSYFYQVGE